MRKIALTLALAVGTTAPAFADIVKCQQGIEKNGQKLQASILKAFTKCKDGYRKAVVKGDPLTTPALSCQTGLAKAIDFGNPVSAMKKTQNGLAKLVQPLGTACSDADLASLGYLPTQQFGDRWARLIILTGLKGAYDTQAQLISDFPNVLQQLGDNGCALCAKLSQTPPCVNTVCDVAMSSGFETRVLGVPVTGPVTGNTVISGCEWQDVLQNEIGLLGSPNLGLRPATVLGNTICNASFRTLGVLSCAGSSMPKVNYSLCQDSDTADGDECTGDVCQSSPAAGTGGACIDYTTAASAQGDVFILSTTRLRISNGPGSDGVSCTDDGTETFSETPAAVIPTTTGSASASVLDYNDTDGNTQTVGPASGVTGPSCAVARSGSSSGLTIVGAFPGPDTVGSPLGDTVTRVTITCN